MKKLKLLIIVFVVFALVGFRYDEDKLKNNDKYIREIQTLSSDSIEPVISFIEEDATEIVLVEGSILNLSDHISVTDNVGVKAVSSFGKFNAETPGEYKITVMAADAALNVATKEVPVKIISQADYEAMLKEMEAEQAAEEAARYAEQQERYNAELRAIIQSHANVDNSDIFALAEDYIGMGGWCNEVATAFLTDYLGRSVNIYDSYSVDPSEAQPGDLVEYANGGNGMWHVAVYLGDGLALHGNWNGTTVIESIYVPGGSSPYFERVN